ncbi:uncharacterized protein L969DRAFT_85445 [Mixia osmundae IAM 14324]|uniref:Dicer-like protein 1 n=1 Tax=Mixia osmundae (strain CBS 9802 / IAM 14324 / JCM 22182 / KY 12970) TaxID=764103 RepID=G7DYT3_MIXOS|nr:uncharacterized protein L969DRAFT_85445 [Mixia osmundae IAM 14324]KEI41639.1 hypothetical protein L969DRAFT_85445 [Mixia osmundae IAM 14324]GAA95743.1 hypothetical protein E5Q_02400 [Mixia osmundae IAM 14324]
MLAARLPVRKRALTADGSSDDARSLSRSTSPHSDYVQGSLRGSNSDVISSSGRSKRSRTATDSTDSLEVRRASDSPMAQDTEDTDLPTKTDGVRVRQYQHELFQKAKQSNTIIRMKTGAGKTLVAVMLILYEAARLRREMMVQERPSRKLLCMLVPTVTLVNQQVAAIREQTSLQVRGFRGDMLVSAWDLRTWQIEFDLADVVVMTPQILLNVLRSAFWRIENIALLIFDEAHHARKKHPYAHILDEFYHPLKRKLARSEAEMSDRLPRILGLTASPVWTASDLVSAISDLERRMDATLVEVKEHAAELAQYNRKPSERCLTYRLDRAGIKTPFEIRLESSSIASLLDLKFWQRIDQVKERLGLLGVDIYICEALAQALARSTSDAAVKIDYVPQEYWNEACLLHSSFVDVLEHTTLTESGKRHISDSPSTAWYGHLASADSSSSDISQKVRILLDHLETYRACKDFTAIIFVQTRYQTAVLQRIVSKAAWLDFLSTNYLVGSTTGNPADMAKGVMRPKQQLKPVQSIREGRCNTLFATSVAEEGLDLSSCNLIVRFDPVSTLVGYIQSRGRARAVNSDYLVLAEADTSEEYDWQTLTASEQQMLDHTGQRDIFEEGELSNGETVSATPTYLVPSSGALLTLSSSVMTLNQAFAGQRSEGTQLFKQPIYEIVSTDTGDYAATVILPPVGTLYEHHRTITGAVASSRSAAKALAAFEAVILLFKAGIINERLVPHYEENNRAATRGVKTSRDATLDVHDADGRKIDVGAVPETIRIKSEGLYGNAWRKDETLYLHEIIFVRMQGEQQRIGFVCGRNVDLDERLHIYEEPGTSTPSTSFTLEGSRTLTFATEEARQEALAVLDAYTRILYQVGVCRRDVEAKLYHFFAPLVTADDGLDIDWAIARAPLVPFNPLQRHTAGELIVCPFRRMTTSRLWNLVTVREDLSPLSAPVRLLPPGQVKLQTDTKMLAWDCYQTWLKVVFNFRDGEVASDEIMIHLDPWPQVCNNLLPVDLHPRKFGLQCAVPASMCFSSRLSAADWKIVMLAPAFLRNIGDCLQARAAIRDLRLPPIAMHRMIEALTLPGSAVGRSYESIETLGDSVLKVLTSVHLYLAYPLKSEGALTCLRTNSVENVYLHHKAVESSLGKYLIHERMRLNTWLPRDAEHSADMGDGCEFERKIQRRALSDCIESILGAAYLTGGLSMAMDTARAFNLPLGDGASWRSRSIEARRRERSVSPRIGELEDLVGYSFSNNDCLIQALTHRSYLSPTTPSYEREEFLGDAMLDFWAITRLYARFDGITPQQLSRLRALLVCNGTLGYVAMLRLRLGEYVLHNADEFTDQLEIAQQQAEAMPPAEFCEQVWFWDPPKVLGDCVEAIAGAIFVDSGGDPELVFKYFDRILGPLMQYISPNMPADPVSRLAHLKQELRAGKSMVLRGVKRSLDAPHEFVFEVRKQEICRRSHRSKAVAEQLTAAAALEHCAAWTEEDKLNLIGVDVHANNVTQLRDWKTGELSRIRDTPEADAIDVSRGVPGLKSVRKSPGIDVACSTDAELFDNLPDEAGDITHVYAHDSALDSHLNLGRAPKIALMTDSDDDLEVSAIAASLPNLTVSTMPS